MRLSSWVAIAVALLAIPGLDSNGQTPAFGITAFSQVESVLTPFTINGAYSNPSCDVMVAPPGVLPKGFFQITPYSCGGTYQGADSESGALYTETAIGRINSAWVNAGTTTISVSSSGGTAGAKEHIGEFTGASLTWLDTLTVTGPPPGTPVILRFTNSINNGDNRWSGGLSRGASVLEASYSLLRVVSNSNPYPPSCPGGQATRGDFAYYPYDVTPSINLKEFVDVCAYSGEMLHLQTYAGAGVSADSGTSSSWKADIDWSDTIYVDSLTPGVTLISASGARYGSPNFKAPAQSVGCNGTFTGIFHGNLQVLPGQNCVFSGGGVTGSVTQTGGKLTLTNTYVAGNLVINGGTFAIGPFATINGNLIVKGIPSDQVANKICSTNIKGYLSLQDSGADFSIGPASSLCAGNSIGTSLVALRNTGTIAIFDDNVGGTLTVQNDSASTKIMNNQVGNALLLQSNTGSTLVSGNVVTHNLQCTSNSSISGSRNTAGAKTGQCAKF